MGRIFPFLILVVLIGLVAYAGVQTYSLIRKQPLSTSLPIPGFSASSTPQPTDEPQVTLYPTPTPNPGINSYLQTNLLDASSTCVHQLLGQDDTNYYLWAICKNPSLSISIPVSLKLDLTSHLIPQAGESYESDVQKIFPESIRNNEFFNDPKLVQDLENALP